jgi:CubicO group peptidase (beta-lactamase class C family)
MSSRPHHGGGDLDDPDALNGGRVGVPGGASGGCVAYHARGSDRRGRGAMHRAGLLGAALALVGGVAPACRSELTEPRSGTATATPSAAASPSGSSSPSPAGQRPPSEHEALLARARALELDTPYVPPPGDPLEHHSAGFASIVCSAVFVSGFSPEFAAENLGYFTSPYAERKKVAAPVVDRTERAVHVRLPNGVTRTARYFKSQGCVTLPVGQSTIGFTPVEVTSALPDPAHQAWPMGDVLGDDPLPAELNLADLRAASDAAFEPPGAMTAAFVVTWRGRVVQERYAEGVDMHTPLAGWSMGKSVIATLMGLSIEQGVYSLEQPAPIPEWQHEGDPRRQIRIADLLNMSSGLRMRAPQDPDYDPSGPYPDHLYLYTGEDSVRYAATRPLEWPPGRVGRYHNTDPVLVNELVRLAVERRGENYLTFPQRALFDRLGIRSALIETDAHGHFLAQGYDFMSARDWARLGNLYLNGGTYQGQRLLSESYVKFVSSVAPAWQEDHRPVYGGFFWLNTDQQLPVPADAYYMSGAGGQTTLIVPSHELVIVRLGHDKGAALAQASLNRALMLLMRAIPAKR